MPRSGMGGRGFCTRALWSGLAATLSPALPLEGGGSPSASQLVTTNRYVIDIQRMSCASPIGQKRTFCTFFVNGPNHLVL